MLTEQFINRQIKLRKSLDFKQLREEGLKHLRQLAGDIWTDYNTHDPGVTLLELLCYAITDLGYRCDFSISDLIASHPENKAGSNKHLFEAHEILPNHPFTILDFRKILIDLPFVRNAWLEPVAKSSPEVFYDEVDKALTYSSKNINGGQNEEIRIKGLYNVWLELSEDDELGNLNSDSLRVSFPLKDENGRHIYNATIWFPDYYEFPAMLQKRLEINKISTSFTPNPDPWYDFTVKVKILLADNTEARFTLLVSMDPEDQNWKSQAHKVKRVLGDRIKDIGNEGFMSIYNRKQIKICNYLNEVAGKLNAHRNLCEDFLSINLVRPQEIGVKAEFGLSLDADPHTVLAKAFFDLHQLVNPSVRFYSLKELLAQNISPELIYDGPLLSSGFIKDENLFPFRHEKTVFVSDVLNWIMSSSPGKIKYITDLRLTNWIENIQLSQPNSNSIALHRSDIYKPVAGIRKSAIICKKGNVEQAVDWNQVEALYEKMLRDIQPDKSGQMLHRIDVPAGRDRKTGHYSSVQNDLPSVYGTTWQGLPEDASAERKAYAKQLKGYLLFYDQLLANFLAQLANVKNLLSMDSEVSASYFYQAVYQVPGAIDLLRDFVGSQGDELTQPELEEAWLLFVSDSKNEYLTKLSQSAEDQKTFLDRRNRFLDHLMARFNEQFTDYSFLMFARNNQQVPDHLTVDKALFLQNYPMLSSQRAKGFATSHSAEVWDTANITGLERRLAYLLGIRDYQRRFLTSGPFGNIRFYQEKDLDVIDEYRFRVISSDNRILLSSHKHYHVINEGYDVVFKVIDFGKDAGNYKILPSSNGRFYFNLYDDKTLVLARRIQLFDTAEMAKAAIDEVALFFSTQFTGLAQPPEEGLFVVENILLRPRFNGNYGGNFISDPILPRYRNDYGQITKEGKDPFSFRITVVLPAQAEKFMDKNFRELAETTIRLETPAHIMPHIHFVNNLQLSRFEHAYKNWLEINSLPFPEGESEKTEHIRHLSAALFELEGAMIFIPEEPDL